MPPEIEHEKIDVQSIYNDELTIVHFSVSDDRIRYWSILDTWTASEAAALILLLDPDHVDSKYIAFMPKNSEISQKFIDNKRIIERSGDLDGNDSPKEIIEMLIQKGVKIPEKLSYEVKISDEISSEKLNKLKIANMKLKLDIENLNKSLNEKRIDSMKKIVGYLSIMTKEYIPGKSSGIHQRVEDDLAYMGVRLTHDTVKSVLDDCAAYLREAGDIDLLIEKASKRVKRSEIGNNKTTSGT